MLTKSTKSTILFALLQLHFGQWDYTADKTEAVMVRTELTAPWESPTITIQVLCNCYDLTVQASMAK